METKAGDPGAFAHFNLHRVPSPAFVVDEAALRRNLSILADVDFGIEVCGKRLTMVPAIAVENIKRVDAVEMMFF